MSEPIYTEVFFDVETQKFFDDTGTNDPADLGVSILSVYRRQATASGQELSGQMASFWEQELPSAWSLFFGADRIIGFNTLNFDNRALKPYAPPAFYNLPHFDILDKLYTLVGRRMSLNSLARDTLGQLKVDAGANAILYWQQHDPESLAKLKYYCEADVAITRDLYDHALRHKFLKYTDHWNNPRTLEIDFSYPSSAPVSKQDSLF